jgi:hypothetical protein
MATTFSMAENTPPLFLNCEQRTDQLAHIADLFQGVDTLDERIRPLRP